MTFTHALATNNYGQAKFIVATSPANGTHTTLAAAMAAASSGDTIFLRNSVTEDVTITPGVNIVAYESSSLNTPSITGKLTMTGAGTSTLSGLTLITNSDFLIAVTGSAASILNIYNCYLNCSNNTGISFTSSSSSALIYLDSCNGNLGITGISLFAHSSAGALRFFSCFFLNNGGSSTANTVSAGSLFPNFTGFTNPTTVSGTTALIQGSHNIFNTNPQNVIPLTVTSTSANPSVLDWCEFNAGSATAVSVGVGATLKLLQCVVMSTNTNTITGAGTLIYSVLSFTNSNTINTTTQTPLIPAFLAYVTNNVLNVTGDATDYTIIFNGTVFNVGSNFNTSTGTFTAPVTGRYQLNATVAFGNIAASHTTGYCYIATSNRSYIMILGNPGAMKSGDGNNEVYWSGSTLADMDAGDTATVHLIVSGSSKTIALASGGGPASITTFFSGVLLT